MCLTNIDIVDGIDCLQVLQHSSGSNKYLTVANNGQDHQSNWGISSTIDGWGVCIESAFAGGFCPAQASNSLSDRVDFEISNVEGRDSAKIWRYKSGWRFSCWLEDIVNVKCLTHT